MNSSNRKRVVAWFLAFILITVGFGVRMFDLTDQPLDFHPTRQLRGAIIARGMYYQMMPSADPELRSMAIAYGNSTGQYEPSIIEKIVAFTYTIVGDEILWISRIYTSLFWIIAGAALFSLCLHMMKGESNGLYSSASIGVALVALGYYLILPFGVQASRSFQPDPGMVMLFVLTIYALYRWADDRSWKWTITAGLIGGIAVLVKVVASYIIGGAAVAIVLYALGIKRFWRNLKVWCMAALMIAPTAIYYSMGKQGRAATYFSGWTLSLSHLLLDPSLYVRWFSFISSLMGLTVILISLIGVVIARSRNRALLLGLWVGYAVYGLFFPYQMYTHNYYHLQLIPILALSLTTVSYLIFKRILAQEKIWQVLFVGVAVMGLLYPAWVGISEQKRIDYRDQPAYWQEVASHLPSDGKILALTQDYGYRLMYYGWRKVKLWPTRGEKKLAELRGKEKEFDDYFAKRIEGRSYFLITAFGQFKDQPVLKQTLNDRYPVLAEGDGYIIFDLTQTVSQ